MNINFKHGCDDTMIEAIGGRQKLYIFFLMACCVFDPIFSYTPQELKKKLSQELKNPSIKAFLDTISYAEGTYKSGLDGYKILYLGVPFTSFDVHPDTQVCNQSLCSTAAGRYMFLKKTWDSVAQRLQLDDFSPLNQDLGAVFLLWEVHALPYIKRGNLRAAVEKAGKIWAPLPGSPLKQATFAMYQIERMFNERLCHYTKNVGKGSLLRGMYHDYI